MLKNYTADNLNSDKIAHGFFTRLGGVSDGLYESLNLGLGSSDKRDNVIKNRDLVSKHFSLSQDRLLTLYQIHSSKVVTVEDVWDVNSMPQADAMVSNKAGVALGILTADCVPVLFADKKNGVIGAAHSGWNGALAGVLQNTIASMVEMGARRENISAAIGPAIAQKSYEVGGEVKEAFTANDASLAEFFTPNENGKFQFDLTGVVRRLLEMEKIESLSQINHDTYEKYEEFYSYRRSTHKKESDYGRQISVICLKD